MSLNRVEYTRLADSEAPNLHEVVKVCSYAFAGDFITIYLDPVATIIYRHHENVNGESWWVGSSFGTDDGL